MARNLLVLHVAMLSKLLLQKCKPLAMAWHEFGKLKTHIRSARKHANRTLYPVKKQSAQLACSACCEAPVCSSEGT